MQGTRQRPSANVAVTPTACTAPAGTCPPDQTTFDYVRERTAEPFEPVYADDSASYVQEYRFDVSKLQPLVAAPHSPDNRKNAADCRDVKIDRVYIGCAGSTGFARVPVPCCFVSKVSAMVMTAAAELSKCCIT